MRVALVPALLAFATGAQAATPVRTCAQRADTDSGNPVTSPTPDDIFVGHRILLAGGRTAGALRNVESGRAGWWWFKSLAVVRRGRRVTISIPPSFRDRLHLRYGRGREAQTFAPCGDREWTYFPGGFLYTKAGCYAVDIRIDGRRAVRERFPLGVGATCAT